MKTTAEILESIRKLCENNLKHGEMTTFFTQPILDLVSDFQDLQAIVDKKTADGVVVTLGMSLYFNSSGYPVIIQVEKIGRDKKGIYVENAGGCTASLDRCYSTPEAAKEVQDG